MMKSDEDTSKPRFDVLRLVVYLFIAGIGATPLAFRVYYLDHSYLAVLAFWIILEAFFVWLLYRADNGRR